MSDDPIVHDVRTGYLGWSNVRAGLEFYRGDGNNNRWKLRESNYRGDQPNGLLLQDDLEKANLGEGSVCVVITMGTRDIKIAERLAAALIESFGSAPQQENERE